MATLTTTNPTDLRDTINKLIEICRDGQHGFASAAKQIEDPALRGELLEYSLQRQEFALDLRNALVQMGAEPDDRSSLSGAIHRGWINLKQALSSNDSYAILSECERGEDYATEAYRDAMAMALPSPVSGLVENQYQAVQRVHDRVRALRDVARGDVARTDRS